MFSNCSDQGLPPCYSHLEVCGQHPRRWVSKDHRNSGQCEALGDLNDNSIEAAIGFMKQLQYKTRVVNPVGCAVKFLCIKTTKSNHKLSSAYNSRVAVEGNKGLIWDDTFLLWRQPRPSWSALMMNFTEDQAKLLLNEFFANQNTPEWETRAKHNSVQNYKLSLQQPLSAAGMMDWAENLSKCLHADFFSRMASTM